ncbi:MAG: AMP-binding protein [Thermincola sp.]|jgi:long-chain acyl-CoA synthetase|nr:AMP-binding protein [Thermincola sp.]MDT3704988.1 AMP-binding protein [Thermincola sp.]
MASAELNTVPKLFLDAVKTRGPRVALREKDFGIWQQLTWDDYYAHVRDFALGLVSLGLKKGDKICIQGENNLEWLFADIAIQASGGVTVGVYPTNPSKEVAYIVNDCEAEIFIGADQENVDKILEVKDQVPKLRYIISMSMKGIKHYNEKMILGFKEVEERGREMGRQKPGLFEEMVAQGQPDDVAVLIYTSGTTGEPKGAVISQRNLVESNRCLADVLKLGENDSYVSYLPLCHALERIFSIVIHILVGYVVSFAESTDTIQKDIQEVAPTFFISVPRIMEKIEGSIRVRVDNTSLLNRWVFNKALKKGYKLAEKALAKQPLSLVDRLWSAVLKIFVFGPVQHYIGLARARFVICGGAPLSPETATFFHALGIPLAELYGMTELSSITCLHRNNNICIGTIGQVIPGWEVKVDEDGELMFRGPGVFQGYYGRPEATMQTLRDGWLYTGDLGAIDADGQVRIIGRKKDIIITSGGKNISPQVIENAIKGSPYIREAVVLGEGQKFIGALIQIEMDVVGNWALNQGIPYATIRDLSHNPQVIELIRQEVNKANQQLARVEQVKKFAFIDRELYHEEGDMTATQKMKRSAIQKKFAALVDAIYGDSQGAINV